MRDAYPAYAGIDPMTSRRASSIWRLPRVRGDRPPQALEQTIRDGPTPRTRGSTLLFAPGAMEGVAYPAYAGIDLTPILSG